MYMLTGCIYANFFFLKTAGIGSDLEQKEEGIEGIVQAPLSCGGYTLKRNSFVPSTS